MTISKLNLTEFSSLFVDIFCKQTTFRLAKKLCFKNLSFKYFSPIISPFSVFLMWYHAYVNARGERQSLSSSINKLRKKALV